MLVIVAFFDGLDATCERDPQLVELLTAVEVSLREQVSLATGAPPPKAQRELIQLLVESSLPIISPTRSIDDVIGDLRVFYTAMVDRLVAFSRGLARAEAAEAQLAKISDLAGQIAEAAVEKYLEYLVEMSAAVPEFLIWAQLNTSRGAQAAAQAAASKLSNKIEQLAQSTGSGAGATKDQAQLLRAARAALSRPVLDMHLSDMEVVVPLIRDAYIPQDCRIRAAGAGGSPAATSWWSQTPVREGLIDQVLALVASPEALLAPVVILGQPGSGKSLSSRVLAGALADAAFLPIRVELRNVHGDGPIHRQIEEGLELALGTSSLSWGRLVTDRSPVLILDGLDELIVASSVPHWDYLERVVEFQRTERELGRPVAVIVTSRLVNARDVRVPRGCTMVRIEPLRDAQVSAWLAVWNRHNAAALHNRGLPAVALETLAGFGELHREPLLMLMLTLYATNEGLHTSPALQSRSLVYERLVRFFALREVRRINPSLSEDEVAREVEEQILQLSVVAVAMFNRGRQGISEDALIDDLRQLLPDRGGLARGGTPFDRFFFIYESQAVNAAAQRSRTFEFLHATFGDYLTARFIVDSVLDAADQRGAQRTRKLSGAVDLQFLLAATSHSLISLRSDIPAFCEELVSALDRDRQQAFRSEVFSAAMTLLEDKAGHVAEPYNPRNLSFLCRIAKGTGNLVLLELIAAGSSGVAANYSIGRLGGLWHGQFSQPEWESLLKFVRVRWAEEWDTDEDRYDLNIAPQLVREDSSAVVGAEIAPRQTYSINDLGTGYVPDVTVDGDSPAGRLLRELALLKIGDAQLNALHAAILVFEDMDEQGPEKALVLAEFRLRTRYRELPTNAISHPRVKLYREYRDQLLHNPRSADFFLQQMVEDARAFEPALAAEIILAAESPTVVEDHRFLDALVALFSQLGSLLSPEARARQAADLVTRARRRLAYRLHSIAASYLLVVGRYLAGEETVGEDSDALVDELVSAYAQLMNAPWWDFEDARFLWKIETGYLKAAVLEDLASPTGSQIVSVLADSLVARSRHGPYSYLFKWFYLELADSAHAYHRVSSEVLHALLHPFFWDDLDSEDSDTMAQLHNIERRERPREAPDQG